MPISAISSWYDYYRANGAVRAPGGFQGGDADVPAEYTYTRPDQSICRPVIAALAAGQDRVTGDYTPFRDARNYMNDIDNVRAASLVAHGNNDWNVMTKHASEYYIALKERGMPPQLYGTRAANGGSPPLIARTAGSAAIRGVTRTASRPPEGLGRPRGTELAEPDPVSRVA